MEVTDILRDRMRTPAGLERMVAMSVGVHVAVAVALLLSPGQWITRPITTPKTVMNISLGGGGPQTGGMTQMGGRPVQVQTPPEEMKREAIRPPAAKTPEMTLPKPGARVTKATDAPAVKQAPDDARGRTPTRGAQTAAGSSVAETGTRGQGFGLSSGGGPGTGSSLDVSDFCCPDYLFTMLERIRTVWNQNQGSSGQVMVKFTIQRDGTLTSGQVERGSGNPTLDIAAQRAIAMTRKLPPLPDAFPNPTLTVHLNFQYQQ
jgi:TonB family protein